MIGYHRDMHPPGTALSQSVLLIGPSTRAMAYSALRAGLQPICYDLFADTDLQAVAQVEVVPIGDYPGCLIERLKQHPPGVSVIYTGGLENHPSIYLKLNEQRPVWGYLHPDPVRGNSIRNPDYLDQIARNRAIPRPRHERLCRDSSRWLVKPRAGAGGRGIRFWNGETIPDTHFLEQHLEGVSLAAVYCCDGQVTRYLGVTEQLVGCDFTHTPNPFGYSGSISYQPRQGGAELLQSPLDDYQLGNPLAIELERIGTALAESDPYLRGLFGVDFLLHERVPCLLEVNPRYTASIEVLELTMGIKTLAHQAAPYQCNLQHAQPPATQPFLGKAIYFAPSPLTFPSESAWSWQMKDPWKVPEYADIPQPGSVIERGQPVMTLFAQGKDRDDVIQQLQHKAQFLDEKWRR